MKNFIRMAQELEVLVHREYPYISIPVLIKVKKALYTQDLDYITNYIVEHSDTLTKYPVIYNYLKKEISTIPDCDYIY